MNEDKGSTQGVKDSAGMPVLLYPLVAFVLFFHETVD